MSQDGQGARTPFRAVLALIPPHLLRYGLVGAACSGLQLAIFAPLHLVIVPIVANLVAFLLSTQANFFLSRYVTWRHRTRRSSVWRQLGEFNIAAGAGVALNSLVFALLTPHTSPLGAAGGALVVAAAAGYVVNSRLVFRGTPVHLELAPPTTEEHEVWTPTPGSSRGTEPLPSHPRLVARYPSDR